MSESNKAYESEGNLSFFYELAQIGLLEDFILDYFPDKFQDNNDFQTRIATILSDTDPDSPFVALFIVRQLDQMFRAFFRRIEQCPNN